MTKERINVTVDKSVYRELKARDDINTSGLVNSFLKRYLRGEEADKAAKRTRAERLEEEAKDMREEAEALLNQAEAIREEFREEQREKEEVWQKAVNALGDEPPSIGSQPAPDPSNYDYTVDVEDSNVSFWADKLEMEEAEFCERFPDKYKIHFESEGSTQNHHYQ